MRLRQTTFLVCLLFLRLAVPAQEPADYPLRIEIPAQSVNETYRILPAGREGVILFYRSRESHDESRKRWYFSLYDTNLNPLWTKAVPLLNELDFRRADTLHDTLSLVFAPTEKAKGPAGTVEVLRIIPATDRLVLNTCHGYEGASADAFGVRNGRAWLGLNYSGQSGRIAHVRLSDGYTRSFALGIGDDIKLLWMEPDPDGLSARAVVRRQVSKKKSEHYLVRYDTSGAIRSEARIGALDVERPFTQVRALVTGSDTTLLLGSYGMAGGKGASRQGPETSAGLFAGIVTGGRQVSMQFRNFLDLHNAATLISEEEMSGAKKKSGKKQQSLAEYSLDYPVLMQPLKVSGNTVVATFELFVPQYHTENFTDFDFYGRPYTSSYSVFDGYRFYTALAAGFDMTGKLLWDNNIEIRNLVSYDLTPKVAVRPMEDVLLMCYLTDGKVGSKVTKGNEVTEKLDFTTLDLLHPGDKLVSENRGLMVPWYGDYYLVSGYQEIRNISLETGNKRLVFSFSKVRYER